MPDHLSPRTRRLFREHLVGFVLRDIDGFFTDAGLTAVEVPADQLPAGQRRSLVECYYAGVDWTSEADVERVLQAYQSILNETASDYRDTLIRQLRSDGVDVSDDGIVRMGAPPLSAGMLHGLQDRQALARYEQRMQQSVDADPELAIGSAKELLEAVSRMILEDAGVEPRPTWSAYELFREAARHLDLSVSDVPDERAGAEEIRRVLGGMAAVVTGTAELRNRFGTGHGRPERPSGLGPRHARLAVGASVTLVNFLLATWDERGSHAWVSARDLLGGLPAVAPA